MRTTRLRHAGALLTAAALLATMTAATVAAPVSAARPTCAGKTATIVGTNRGETIRGTNRADVIVARGGHDRIYGRGGHDIICGGPGNDLIVGGPGNDRAWGANGHDRLYGGSGYDHLYGGAGNDRFKGGLGRDACFQALGSGSKVSCELPEPPTLAIAYSDINNNQVFDAGDVMISKLLDTDRSGGVSIGDTIKMGKYPTSPNVVTPAGVHKAFEPWRVKSHTLTGAAFSDTVILARTKDGGRHQWQPQDDLFLDYYVGDPTSGFIDRAGVNDIDETWTKLASPSQPTSSIRVEGPGTGDDPFIDVIIYS
jgi:Ca2+-binding RTX toxin-like protein